MNSRTASAADHAQEVHGHTLTFGMSEMLAQAALQTIAASLAMYPKDENASDTAMVIAMSYAQVSAAIAIQLKINNGRSSATY